MSRRVVATAAGVCVLRNAADLVPFLCGHYLRLGLGRIRFIDDGSTDGTRERLHRLAERIDRIEVRRVEDGSFDQVGLVTAAANELIESGARLIFPFDADEFWHLSPRDVRRLAQRCEPRVIVGRWTNFAQSRRVTRSRLGCSLLARYRVPRTGASQEEVLSFAQPWLAFDDRKVAFWSREAVELAPGQHELRLGPRERQEPDVELFHLPLRSREELDKRATDYEPRRATVRQPGYSWQSRFHREVVLDGRGDAVWAANSADSAGRLDVFGRTLALEPDYRLQRTLATAFWHLAWSRGVAAWRRLLPTNGRLADPSVSPGANRSRP